MNGLPPSFSPLKLSVKNSPPKKALKRKPVKGLRWFFVKHF